jgi:hypothetical protein
LDIEEVLKRNESSLMRLPNVLGVSIGERAGTPVILLLVKRKVPESSLRPQEIIPKSVDGYATKVMEVGSIEAQSPS